MLKDLYSRGAHEVLLGVFDGLPGLDAALRETYPKADVQHYIQQRVVRRGKVKPWARIKLLEAENDLLKKIDTLERQAKLDKH